MYPGAEHIIGLLGGRAAVNACALTIVREAEYSVYIESLAAEPDTEEARLQLSLRYDAQRDTFAIAVGDKHHYIRTVESGLVATEFFNYVDYYAGGCFSRLLPLFVSP